MIFWKQRRVRVRVRERKERKRMTMHEGKEEGHQRGPWRNKPERNSF